MLPIVIPAVCLSALWGYTADGLVGTHTRLHAAAERASSVAEPAQGVLSRLQNERRLTEVWQAGRTPAARKDLDTARAATDAAVQDYRKNSSPGLDTGALQRSAKSLGDALVFLPERRKAIDQRTLSITDAFQFFTDAVSDGTGLLGASLRSGDARFARGGAATASVAQITEMLSREDALLSGALSGGRLTAATRTQFAQYAAIAQQLRTALNPHDLPGDSAAFYARITGDSRSTAVGRIEGSVAGGQGALVPPGAASWPTSAGPLTADLQRLSADSLAGLSHDASQRSDNALLETLLGTAALLAALAGCVVLVLRSRRSAVRRLARLQAHTEELSGAWLPRLLARVENGERLDPNLLAPQGPPPTDEVERLGAAIDQMGRIAAETVIRQSRGREGTEKVFGQLIRRTQTLIHRLISLLDDLERKHEDSDLLKDIFKVDHLATRVRRHAESLVILSGSPPSRRMSAPVSIIDVMRSAVAETEQYTRIKVKNLPADRHLSLTGRAVADVTHLLAELIENGTSFSPPDTQVFVSATKVVKGLAVHIEDHGLGMPQHMLDQANELLLHPPRLDMTALGEDPRLGHFVVARLAERHKIKVELRDSVYGGTLVVVLLPSALLEEVESPVLDQLRSSAASGMAAVEQSGRQPVPAGSLSAGPATPARALTDDPGETSEVYAVTHSHVPDHSGFPEYGGAGLLPAASEHPAHQNSSAYQGAAHQDRGGSEAPRPGYGETDYTEGPYFESAGINAAAQSRYQTPLTGQVVQQPQQQASAQPQPMPQPVPQPMPEPAGPAYGYPQSGPARQFQDTGAQDVQDTQHARNPQDTQDDQYPLTTPQILPHRVRGASLAQQLRREEAYTQGRPAGDGDQVGISPAASARAMIAIQQGLQRARMSEGDDPGGSDGRPGNSGSSGANQP